MALVFSFLATYRKQTSIAADGGGVYGDGALSCEELDWAFEPIKDVFQTIERIARAISSQTDLGHGAA